MSPTKNEIPAKILRSIALFFYRIYLIYSIDIWVPYISWVVLGMVVLRQIRRNSNNLTISMHEHNNTDYITCFI